MLGRLAQGPKTLKSASPKFPSEKQPKSIDSGQFLGVHAPGPDWPGKRIKNAKKAHKKRNNNVEAAPGKNVITTVQKTQFKPSRKKRGNMFTGCFV